jgi:hypothetical protein
MTVSPVVVVPVILLVLFSRPILFFSYFCRCESALAVNIVMTSDIWRGWIKGRSWGWAGYGDIEANGGVRAGVVGVGWICWIWVEG